MLKFIKNFIQTNALAMGLKTTQRRPEINIDITVSLYAEARHVSKTSF